MKFSTILVLYLSAMAAPSVLAAPLRHVDRCSPGDAGVRCIGHSDEHALVLDPSFNGGNPSRIHARQLQPLISIISGLPILGPILGPLLQQLLGGVGLAGVDVASASTSSLNAEQVTALASFEYALSNAVRKTLPSNGNPEGGAQTKVRASGGVYPLGDVTTGLPMVGAFLQPIVPFLEALGLDSIPATSSSSVFSTALLNEDQSTKLARFQSILKQEIEEILPNDSSSTPSDAPLPSQASPEDVKASPTPSPDTSEDEDSDSNAPSPDDASPADVPVATPLSSPGPK